MAHRWSTDPQYSHGYLVPVFAMVLLWFRRDEIKSTPPRLDWWGIPVLFVATAMRFAAARYYFDWIDSISLLLSLAGICLLTGGWVYLRWAWPAIAFLFFMLPLPFFAEVALAHPLQRLATEASTYALQTLGIAAFAEGNIIVVDDLKLGVLEACSGLGMLMTFLSLSTAVAIAVRRPWTERLFIVASAIPIALIANVVRITVTGVLYHAVDGETAHLVFHDLAGWLMMPLALTLVWLELVLLDRLFVVTRPAGPLPIAFADSQGYSDRQILGAWPNLRSQQVSLFQKFHRSR
jgi:exosortase